MLQMCVTIIFNRRSALMLPPQDLSAAAHILRTVRLYYALCRLMRLGLLQRARLTVDSVLEPSLHHEVASETCVAIRSDDSNVS